MLESGTSYTVTNSRAHQDRPARASASSAARAEVATVAVRPWPDRDGDAETAGLDANPDLSPLSVTDEFGFGLGLCGYRRSRGRPAKIASGRS